MSDQAYAAGQQAARQEAQLAAANRQLQLDLLELGVAAAGTVDPSPTSDLFGAGIAAARGDLVGAGLSLVSMIPYAGDLLAKGAKGTRLARNVARLRRTIAAATDAIAQAKQRASNTAAALLRAREEVGWARASTDRGLLARCRRAGRPANLAGRTLPVSGRWSGPPGNSNWRPVPGPDGVDTPRMRALRDFNRRNGLPEDTPIPYRDGFPDFSRYQRDSVRIRMSGTDADFDQADRLSGWTRARRAREGLTWHHHEDGTSMILVPSAVNAGARHDGGATLARSIPGF